MCERVAAVGRPGSSPPSTAKNARGRRRPGRGV